MSAENRSLQRSDTPDPLLPLLKRMVDRDQSALASLYDQTVATLFSLALRIVHDRGLAEEVCEDTFFQAWRQADRYDERRARVMTWLMLMCRSRALDALRALDEAQPMADPDALRALDAAPSTALDDQLAQFHVNSAVQLALEKLPAFERQAVALAFFRGLTHSEIAAAWNMPVGSVKTLLHRAFTQLRAECELNWIDVYGRQQ